MSTAATRARLAHEEVDQRVDGDERVWVRKERWRVGERLAVLRKHARGPAPRRPVLLVHGFAQNRYTWHTSRRSLSAWLAREGWDTWNMDLPGHGDSRAEGHSEGFDAYVDALGQVLRAVEHETGQTPLLVGHSLGGAVAYAAATRFPVRGVVGIGALFRFAAANPALRALCHLTEALRAGPLGAVQVRTRLAGRLLARLYSLSDIAGYALPVSGWAPGSMEEDVLAERLERGFDWTSANAWFDMARWGASGRFAHEDAWRQTRVPVLVMAGDLDHLALPDEARLAHDLSGSDDRALHVFGLDTTGLRWGHLDLVLGRHAPRHTWPVLGSWLEQHA